MKDYKISVVIPVYNGEKTLEKCLLSVLTQNFQNYEVILVDNNSTDSTKKIAQEFVGKFNNLKYIFEKKKGRGSARNAGINASCGQIIAMTDADCIVPQNWLCKITKPIISGQEKISLGFEYDLINNYWTRNIQKSNWDFVNRKRIGNYIKHIDTKNFAIDAILMKEFMFNEDLVSFEDFELYLRIKDKSRIFFNPEIKVGHRHKTSLIQVIKLNIDRAIWTKKIFKLYKEKTINQKKEPMFESLSLINFLLFPFWAIFQFTKKPFSRVFFLIISEASWRIGLLISR